MGGNFRFTGAPKTSMYQHKGLDYFLAAPKLQAEVRGAAMKLNQATDVDKRGVHSSDMKAVNAMTSKIDEGREKMTDILMDNGPLTDANITAMVKNFNNKKEADQNVYTALQNAKRIEQYDQTMFKAGVSSNNPLYYEKLKERTMGAWQGTFSQQENGEVAVNEFAAQAGPKQVDVNAYYRKKLETAYKNMTDEEKAQINPAEDFKIFRKKMEGGTQLMYQTRQARDKMGNTSAIDKVKEDMLREMNDSNTEVGAYMGLMGDNFSEGVVSSLENIHTEYSREAKVAAEEKLQIGRFIPDGTGTGAGYTVGPSAVNIGRSTGIKFKNRTQVKGITLGESGDKYATSDFVKDVNRFEKQVFGRDGMTVGDVQSALGSLSGAIDNNPFTAFLSNTQKSGHPATKFATTAESLKQNLAKLSALNGKDASLSFQAGELSMDEIGEGNIVSEDLFELRSDIYNDIQTLQNGYSETATRASQNYYSSSWESTDSKGKVTNMGSRYAAEASRDIENKLVVNFEIDPETNKPVNISQNYTDGEDNKGRELSNMMEVNAVRDLTANYGKVGDEEGNSTGGAMDVKVTSANVNDFFPDLAAGGNDLSTTQMQKAMSNMITWSKVDPKTGNRQYTMVQNDQAFPTALDTPITYDGDKQATVSSLVGEMPIGSDFTMKVKGGGEVKVTRSDIGFILYHGGEKPANFGQDQFGLMNQLSLIAE